MIVVNVAAEIDPANLAAMKDGIATMKVNFYEATPVTPAGM